MDEDLRHIKLLDRAASGDRQAWGDLLLDCQPRLQRLLACRLDARLAGRVDANDVLQETCLEATTRQQEFLADRSVPFYVWLRFLALQKLAQHYRRHVTAQARDVSCEVSLDRPAGQATSLILAEQLLGNLTTPSETVSRRELRKLLHDAVDELDLDDREIILLRNFEQLSNVESAGVLAIQPSAASNRYVRALARLKQILERIPEFRDEGLAFQRRPRRS